MPNPKKGERSVTFNCSEELYRKFKAYSVAYGYQLRESFPEALNLWLLAKVGESDKA